MALHRPHNYLRSHRRKSGLTQHEVAVLLGTIAGGRVSRYENRHRLPPLRAALGYGALFGVPVDDLFPGVRESVRGQVVPRVERMIAELRQKQCTGRHKRYAMRKLAWLMEKQGRHISLPN